MTRKKKTLQFTFKGVGFQVETQLTSLFMSSRHHDNSLKVTIRGVLPPDVEFNLVGHYFRFILNSETIVRCSSDNEPNVIVGGNKSPLLTGCDSSI